MNGTIESLNQRPVQDVKGDLIILTRRRKMPNQSLSSDTSSGSGSLLIIQEADHKLAERQLFEGTKGLHKPVKR